MKTASAALFVAVRAFIASSLLKLNNRQRRNILADDDLGGLFAGKEFFWVDSHCTGLAAETARAILLGQIRERNP